MMVSVKLYALGSINRRVKIEADAAIAVICPRGHSVVLVNIVLPIPHDFSAYTFNGALASQIDTALFTRWLSM
jgi:hypothetical protein